MCKHHCQERKNYIFENAGEPLILHLQRLVDSGLRMKLDVLHGREHGAAVSQSQWGFNGEENTWIPDLFYYPI